MRGRVAHAAEVAPEERAEPAPPLAPAARWRQALAAAALAAGLAYLVWRWGFTLALGSLWLSVPLAVAESYGLLMVGLLAFSSWRLTDRPAPPPLTRRSVAVLVTTYDETSEVLRPTVLGALGLEHEGPLEVWVLDDGGRPWVERMCADLGARYLSRPAPRRDAKAGNLNHAIRHVDAEFLVTLDADHVPRPGLIERTLGWFADPKVAVVQGPQAFYNRGYQHPRGGEDPLRNEQSIFFDVLSRGKDRHNAAFWCGCPSVIRRQALVEVGGVATDTLVEDAHTTMRLHAAGWRTVYRDEVLALGLAPEDIAAFVVQRGRWARGSIQMLRRDPPMLKPGLTLRQRLEYTASTLHFLEGPQRLIGLMVPPIVLATGAVPVAADPLVYLAAFLPAFVLVPLASQALTLGRYRFVEGERLAIARMEAYTSGLSALVRGRGGRFRVTPKGAPSARVSVARVLRLPLAIAAATIGALTYQALAQTAGLPDQLPPGAYAVTALWALANVGLVGAVVVRSGQVRHRRRSHRFPVAVEAAYATAEGETPGLPAQVENLSQHGLSMVVGEACPPGTVVRAVLLLDEGPVTLTGTVISAAPSRHRRGQWRLGVDLHPLEDAVRDALVRLCFRHPFGPEPEVVVVPTDAPVAPTVLPSPGVA
jgi:cellulose synthase (UDP-forming)